MRNFNKSIYWSMTILMCLIFSYSIFMNIFRYEEVTAFYDQIGFPMWAVYPVAMLKIIALAAIISRKNMFMKEWAYAALFFDAVIAFSAHSMIGDGIGEIAFIAAVAVMMSRIFEEKVYPENEDGTEKMDEFHPIIQ